LLKIQEELDNLGQELAHEKMARASAEADLDAVKSKKPDTSEVDALRKELQTLKDQHQASLLTAQQEMEKATEEHLATKASLEQAKAELEEHLAVKTSLEQAKAELEEQLAAKASLEQAKAELEEQLAAKASLEQEKAKLEERLAAKAALEQAKAQLEEQKADVEAKLKTSQDDYLSMHSSLTELAEEAHKKVANLEARLKEAEAQLKVKDAELAEAKV
jgi:chromosome segregation ATPase